MNALAMKFEIPEQLNAAKPPERRGIRRDFVRMMVLNKNNGEVDHSTFFNLDQYLKKGDVLVLNNSRTVPAILNAKQLRSNKMIDPKVEIRLAHRKSEDRWEALIVSENVVEGDRLNFSSKLSATIIINGTREPFYILEFSLSNAQLYNEIYNLGEPVRYEYIEGEWGLDYYQTVYASVPGSVEMPSAGRAFSWELLLKLQRKGVKVAFIQLHTGLSYLLDDKYHQAPSENTESYQIPTETVELIQKAKETGGRVVAVGTTVVRALETAVNKHGDLIEKSGWTNLYITKNYPLKVVDGLITGLHEPEASHLQLLSAFIDEENLMGAYHQAINESYLWHEFGDMNLIL
ncbi:S-adenosylmethionine:tRNA ribosyltransferase-isomerase [Chengkuizengella axinellae]|uniref:S-adenosylmethionine:tRNA ribosyltransferase-isomerase n=1 Tax=Chengkuizengella axinellae TaxID=3064388 RepID=A0ABT9J1A6_9BACL|nr:S-adenosylmethionine:tRNA ribosyltransferase-isomerase [Chengkuizengella sp. 2205SS18-9]MDP5275358.1 S-adenosylmethionine:tRNA ribosyltransferase-isomerase [Chengkuizengella sp. 2205SS18-9]